MKKIFKCFINTLLSFLGILIATGLIYNGKSYSIFSLLIFILIYYFYYNYHNKFDKRTNLYSRSLSILLSILLVTGNIVSYHIYEKVSVIFNFKNICYMIIGIIGLSIFLTKLFNIMFNKINKVKIKENHGCLSNKYFLLMVLLLFLGSFIYFIRFYPAIMTTDSYYVLHNIKNKILSDHHTFGHTWFVGLFIMLADNLFHNINFSIAFFILIQMIIMSFIFGNAIRFLYDKGINKNICFLCFLFCLLNPLYAYYNITLWRDILFGGVFVNLFIILYNFIEDKKINICNIILYILSVLVLLFFRNNGIYVFLFMIPFMIIFIKNNRLLYVSISVILVIMYYVIKGPVFNYFNVEKTRSIEAFSMPLQQIARVISYEKELSNDDFNYLNELFGNSDVKKSYNPIVSDPIKAITNQEILNNDKLRFAKTYLNVLAKYPNICIEAYFIQTLGFWYPDVMFWATGSASNSGALEFKDVYTHPLTPNWYNKLIDSVTSRNIPMCNIIWSSGLMFIILLISSFILCYFKKYKYLLCYIPLYGLWLTIMLATPVFNELRYVYGLFTSIILIIFLPFIVRDEYKFVKKNQGR